MGELVQIDDTNYQNFINPVVDGERKACASYGMFMPGGSRVALSAPRFADQQKIPLIPESEWDDVIAQRRKDGATLKQFCEDLRLDVLNQGQTNYCWCNGFIFSAMVARLRESGQVVRLSPASVAAPVKNFQNRGGWGEEALEYMLKHGANLQYDWPANAIDRKYFTSENKEKAMRNQVIEYYRCESWEEVGSAIIAGHPCAVGYNWWGHLVCGVDIEEGAHDLVIANSWGQRWGDNGFGVLKGSKKYPNGDSVAVVSMQAM